MPTHLSRAFAITAAAGFLLLLGLLAAPSLWSQDPHSLKPQGYVNDFANVLSTTAQEQLAALCTEVNQKAHAQISVVTVNSLEGRPIEDYSIDLATKWGIGPKQLDRGVLILLAVQEHRYRIEVGYGLEGILPDGKVGGIGREAVPLLRQGNYDAAILLMTRRVADVIAQDRGIALTTALPIPLSRGVNHVTPSTGDPIYLLFVLLFLGYFWLRIWMARGSARYYHRGGSGWWMGPMIGSGWGGGFGGGGRFGGGGGFGGFGGGGFGGGGASGSW